MTESKAIYPRAFVRSRLHSLLGLWIVLFLIEHLITNSQAALLIGDNGEGFIRGVNFIKNLPYLPVIEIVLIGVPILFHAYWGIRISIKGKMNSFPNDSTKPKLTQYSRNQAYSWQRLTSWILLVGIIAHVAYMRFYRYPVIVEEGKQSCYFVRVGMDAGLYTVAERLGVKLYDESAINEQDRKFDQMRTEVNKIEKEAQVLRHKGADEYSSSQAATLDEAQKLRFKELWLNALKAKPLSKNQVIAEATNFGAATLLMVRDTFKGFFHSILYTIFVLAASFHAFNGLWTFMITWGFILGLRSQARMVKVCYGIMTVVTFLGLAAIWGTYWINLRY